MLSAHELARLCDRLGLSGEARAIVETIRSSPPARRVRSMAGNVSVRYPSRKMGVTIQAESHRVELAGLYEYEHDQQVLEFYDQPPAIKLIYQAKNGRQVGVWHTPDYFVLRAGGIGWEEWKTDAGLERLSQTMPGRYCRRDAVGHWQCPPGEHFAAQFGLFYRLRCSSEIDWVLQRNLRFLNDYLIKAPSVDQNTAEMVLAVVKERPGVTLDALLDKLGAAHADDIYTLIVSGRIYVDLHAAALAEPQHVQLFPDQETGIAYAMVGNARTIAGGMAGDIPQRLAEANPADLREANRRHAIITPYLAGLAGPSSAASARTIRRWLAQWRLAEQGHGCGYLGLLPRWRQRGNRNQKLPDTTLAVIDEFLTGEYETLKQKRKFVVYAALQRACEERGLLAPSYPTFVRYVNHRPRQQQVARRQGPRAGAEAAPSYWELSLTTPRHGDRPLEIGHLDHTQLDVELVCSPTGRNLGRPWATFLSDAFSRRLLAVCLTFDPPSYRSCMLALRECVRRYERLPEAIVVDGGAEFESVYFETLLARYGCTKKTRPGGRPRFGSVCERLFGTTNTRFVHTLAGNTQLTRIRGKVTKSVNPKGQACWTLAALATRLCEWAYEVYDTLDHPALGQSPRETFAAGLQTSGRRPQRHIAYDEDFRMLTLPTTQKGRAKLRPGRGIKVNYLYYWSDAFLDPDVEGTQVPVRYDPFDAGLAYAFIRKRWVRCISEHHARFAGRSEREIQLASAELHRRHQRHNQQFRVTARQLADFLASVEGEEVVLEQRVRDAEARTTLEPLVGTPLMDPAVVAVLGADDSAEPDLELDEPLSPALTGGSSHDALVIYHDY
jgi:transposase InsO family protein